MADQVPNPEPTDADIQAAHAGATVFYNQLRMAENLVRATGLLANWSRTTTQLKGDIDRLNSEKSLLGDTVKLLRQQGDDFRTEGGQLRSKIDELKAEVDRLAYQVTQDKTIAVNELDHAKRVIADEVKDVITKGKIEVEKVRKDVDAQKSVIQKEIAILEDKKANVEKQAGELAASLTRK